MTANPLLTAAQSDDDLQENTLRPQTLADFIGQQQARDNLRVFIGAAKGRSQALDHVLFHGPPGLGKTTLAQIVAREMGVGFRSTSGPILTKAGDLAAILTSLQPQDVLFIDEIHRLTVSVEEMLYTAMEDFKLDLMIGEGPAARAIRIELPPFTLVGATTRLGLISNPLRDRFGIPVRLNFYEPQELVQVVTRASHLLQVAITSDGAMEIARRARGTPRIAVRLLKRVADFAQMESSAAITPALADRSLKLLEVDERGLDSNDRRYLNFIAEHYNGGPVGVETIAAGLSEQRDVIEETIEPFLIQLGFINRTPRGRMLTPGAFAHLGRDVPKALSASLELPLE